MISDAGLVIDLSPRPSGFIARVAGQPGRLMQLEVTLSPETIYNKCSCGVSGSPCDHAIAALFTWEKRYPDKAKLFLETKEELPEDIMANSQGAEVAEAAPTSSSAPTANPVSFSTGRVPTLESVLINLGTKQAEIALKLTTDEDIYQLEAEILFGKRTFSSTNIKGLVENGIGPGKINIKSFSLNDQFLMQLLISCPQEGRTWQLNANHICQLFTLRRETQIKINGSPVYLQSKSAKPCLIKKIKSNGFDILPAVRTDEVISAEHFQFIIGNHSIWAIMEGNAWHIQSPLPSKIFHTWFNQPSLHLGSLPEGDFILDIVENVASVNKEAVLQPRVLLNWNNLNIECTLVFDYSGVLIPFHDPRPVISSQESVITRDWDKEKDIIEGLSLFGFNQNEKVFSISDFDKIIKFVLAWRNNQLPVHWLLSCSPAFQRALLSDLTSQLSIKTHQEDKQNVEVDFLLYSQNNNPISWTKFRKAIQTDQEYILSEDGFLVKIDEKIKPIIKSLPEVTVTANGQIRFPRHHALLMSCLLSRYMDTEDQSDWAGLFELIDKKEADTSLLPEKLHDTLRPYQLDGLNWLMNMRTAGCGSILADEMGLGKTIQTLSLLCSISNEDPSIVVCPSSLMENWQNEAKRFAPGLKTCIISGNTDRKQVIKNLKQYDLAITSYALLRRDVEEYTNIHFNCVVLDEAQNIKNHRSQSALSCRALHASYRLALTGTPLENSATDLWSVFEFLIPGLLGSRKHFESIFKSEDVDDKQRIATIGKLKPFILRRLKADVLPQLPPKQEQIINFHLSEEEDDLYQAVAEKHLQTLLETKEGFGKSRMEILSLITRLRQICSHPALLPEEFKAKQIESSKFKLFKELIEEMRPSSHRALVFSQFTSMLQIMREWMDEEGIKYAYLDGSTKNRQSLVDEFNEDDSIQVFLLSLKAGGTGLNLTGADTVIHYDNWWNPMVVNQATDRAHRMGQKNKVTSIKLVAADTIEDKIIELQKRKEVLFDQLVSGSLKSSTELSEDDMRFLLT